MRGYGPFFFIAEAFRGLRANSMVNLLAVGTISMAMLIVGFFLIVFFNVRSAVNDLGDRLEMSVYLKDGLTEHEKEFLLHRIEAEPGVRQVSPLIQGRGARPVQEKPEGPGGADRGPGRKSASRFLRAEHRPPLCRCRPARGHGEEVLGLCRRRGCVLRKAGGRRCYRACTGCFPTA